MVTLMTKVFDFPFSRMSREAVTRAAQRASERGALITSAAIDGSIRLTIDSYELWYSADEFADLLDQWTETLHDAFSQELKRRTEDDTAN